MELYNIFGACKLLCYCIQMGATPQVGGYGYVSTPSYTPGGQPGATPMMTWGEIEGTPFRIETDIDMTPGIGYTHT